jgi:hypothetical protein
MTSSPRTDVAGKERPIGQLIGDITDDLSRLFRQEVELAKAEALQEGRKAAVAAANIAAAGVAGVLAATLLSLAAMFALAELMHIGWAAVIVALLWTVVAVALQAAGRQKLRSVAALPQTTETLKENAQWLQNPTK